MERDKVGGEFVTGLISEVPIFSVLQKPPVVYKHFICVKFKDFITGMLYKKSSSIKYGHKILQNEDLCYFQNSGIDQCCVIFPLTDYLCTCCDFVCFL